MIKNSLEYVVQPALVLGAAYLMGNSVAQRNFAYKVAVAGLLGKHLIVSSSSQNRQQANQMATTSIFAEAFFLSFLSIASAQVAKRSASMFEWSLTKSGAICSAQWATSFALSKIKIQRERPLPENLPDFFTADTQYDHQGRPVIPQGLTLKNAIEAVEILAGSQANKGFITSLFLKDQNSLRDWLFRMKDCKDFQTNTEAICQHIISFFNEADKNPTFRDSFLETIEEAASTCGDRVSLSLIYVGVRHRLTEIDHRNLNVLAEFLKGVYALDLLRQITYEKHERQEDEVENYLIYPVKLKAILDLPIIIDDMQFNNASATEQDLQDAAARVIESVNNPATFHAWLIEGECFLIGSHIWENALKEQYKAEIDVINGKRYELLEEDNGVQKANDYYRDEMLKLTRQALA